MIEVPGGIFTLIKAIFDFIISVDLLFTLAFQFGLNC
jgi:hypothetical protein